MEKKVLDATYDEVEDLYLSFDCTGVDCKLCKYGFGDRYCLLDYTEKGKTLRQVFEELIKDKEHLTMEVEDDL